MLRPCCVPNAMPPLGSSATHVTKSPARPSLAVQVGTSALGLTLSGVTSGLPGPMSVHFQSAGCPVAGACAVGPAGGGAAIGGFTLGATAAVVGAGLAAAAAAPAGPNVAFNVISRGNRRTVSATVVP